jgi:tetratricopeptide (TPR) repeat protein
MTHVNTSLALLFQGQLQNALDRCNRAVALNERFQYPGVSAVASYILGVINTFRGALAEGEANLRKAVELSNVEGNVVFAAISQAALGLPLVEQEKYDEAMKAALAGIEALGGKQAPLATLMAQTVICAVQLEEDQYQLALKTCQDAFELNQRSGGSPLFASDLLHAIGIGLEGEGKYTEAISTYENAIDVCSSLEIPLFCSHLLRHLASAYQVQGRFDDALRSYTTAINLLQPLGRPTEEATLIVDMGDLYFHKGSYDKAIESYRLANQREPDGMRRVLNTALLARSYWWKGDSSTALLYCDSAYSQFQRFNTQTLGNVEVGLFDRARTNTATKTEILNLIGDCYAELKRPQQALLAYREILAAHANVDHPWCKAVANHSIGNVYYGERQWSEALKAYTAALNDYRQVGMKAKQVDMLGVIAVTQWQSGNRTQATASWQEAESQLSGYNSNRINCLEESSKSFWESGG